MFCEKCGTKNEDGAKFCEGCGVSIEVEELCGSAEVNPTSSQKAKFVAPSVEREEVNLNFKNVKPVVTERKPMSLKNKIILSAVGVLVITCGALYSLGKVITSPDRIVEKYFECISTQNYAEAYEYMDIDNNEFTTKDIFAKVMENRNDETSEEILNYTIKETLTLEKNPLIKNYTVTYTKRGNSNTSSMNIALMKQSSKKWMFYDDYKIAEDGLIAKDYTITIPHGVEVYIDDIKVSEDYAINNDEVEIGAIKSEEYVIPSIFIGSHTIKVSAPFAKNKIFDKYIEDGGYVDIYSLELSDEAKKEATKIAEEFLTKAVGGAIEKKSFDELKTYLSATANTESIEEEYESIESKGIDEEGLGVKSATLSQLKSTMGKEYQSDFGYDVTVNYNYTYTAVREDWYEETVEEYTPERAEKGNAVVSLIYEDGKWMVLDFYTNLYFYY